MNQELDPKLDAPGAGLPTAERWMLSTALRMVSKAWSNEQALQRFQHSADRIFALVGDLDGERGRARVLVPRLHGIEDSSRYWSPWMVLQHLVIVDHGMLGLIEGMVAGKQLTKVVSTAEVKPSTDAGPEVVEQFRKTVAHWSSRIPVMGDLHTRAKHPHPWFGPMNAHRWLCLGAVHHDIHRKQLEAILQGAR